MAPIVLLLVLFVLLASIVFAALIATEIWIDGGRSAILETFKGVGNLYVTSLLLRPVRIAPPRATLAVVGVLAVVGLVGWTLGIVWRDLGALALNTSVPLTRTLAVFALPILSAVAFTAFIAIAIEGRGIASPADLAAYLAGWGAAVGVTITTATWAAGPEAGAFIVGYANLFYFGLHLGKSGAKYRARIDHDADFLPARKLGSRGLRVLWVAAQWGAVPISDWVARYLIREPSSKDEFKLRVVLAYHMHQYAEAKQLARRGMAASMAQEGRRSDILLSYECLATARLESIDDAVEKLDIALSANEKNYYYRSNLSYLLWTSGHLGRATSEAARALREYARDHGRVCVQTATFLSLFLCEQQLERLAVGERVDRDRLGRAFGLIWRAYEVKRSGLARLWGEGSGSLLHNLGLATVLLASECDGDEREELLRFAFGVFARAVWFESHDASRLRLAIFHMVGSREFTSSAFQLERIRWSWLDQPLRRQSRFGRSIEANLRRIEQARREGKVFGSALIFLQGASEAIPEGSVVEGGRVEEEIAHRRGWVRLQLREVLSSPFGRLPRSIRSAVDLAPDEPWMLGD